MIRARLCGAVFVLFVLGASQAFWLSPLGRWLIVQDPMVRADVIVPLAGNLDRLVEAARLYEDGWADAVVVVPLPLDNPVSYQRHIDNATTVLRRNAVPGNAIEVLPNAASTTFHEARLIRSFAQRNAIRTLVVVTNSWHSRRARVVLETAFAGSDTDVRVRAVDGDYHPDSWWLHPQDRTRTVSEYAKLVAHYLGLD